MKKGAVLRFEHILTPDGLERHKRLEIDQRGVIVAVEDDAGPDFDGWLALPGMPNAHSHCFQRAMVGMGEAASGDDSFWSWREAMYGLAGTLRPEELADVAARAFADMLAAGFTSVAEFHYLHHLPDGTAGEDMARAVAAGAERAGIRLMLLPVLYQNGGFGRPAEPRQRRFVHGELDDYLRLLERLRDLSLGVAPHSLRAVTPEIIAELDAAADRILGPAAPRHIHVCEQRREVAECLRAYGRPPVALLADHVNLDQRWNLVHATHASEAEIALIAGRGVTVVVCPVTEAYLGDGLFDAVAFQDLGGPMAIGTDSNVRIDAAEELRWLEYGQRLKHGRRACLATDRGLGGPLWNAASLAGAQALGLPVGRIAPGSPADLVTLDRDGPMVAGLGADAALDALVTAGDGRDFAAVYVGGNRLAEHGVHRDESRISGAYAGTVRALRERL